MKYNRIMKNGQENSKAAGRTGFAAKSFFPSRSFYPALPEAEYCGQMFFSGRDKSSRPFDKQPEGGISRGQIN